MTVNELIEEAKRQARDTGVDPLWFDDELVGYLNWAEQDACRRANLIYDETTANVAVYSVLANANWIALSEKVIKIEAAWWGSAMIWPFDKKIMDVFNRTWESQAAGTPGAYTVQANKVGLYPKPSGNGSLTLRVSRLPLTDLSPVLLDASPEIPAQYHEGLVAGMLHKAFLKNDSETYNKGASDAFLAEFERIFGPIIPVVGEVELRNSPVHIGGAVG